MPFFWPLGSDASPNSGSANIEGNSRFSEDLSHVEADFSKLLMDSYLIATDISLELHYVIPLKYVSRNFPDGHYSGFSRNFSHNIITFSDSNIRKVLN